MKVAPEQFSEWYKWLVVGEDVPLVLHHARYNADITLLRTTKLNEYRNTAKILSDEKLLHFDFVDIYIHPINGPSIHPWATWSEKDSFHLHHENERILRRNNLKKYCLKISTPVSYSKVGDFHNRFLTNLEMPMKARCVCKFFFAILIWG